MPLNIVAA